MAYASAFMCSHVVCYAWWLCCAHQVQWLANAVGMSLALLAMQLTQTTHPPGGATALIACSMAQLPAW